ncbi:MAG TPA: chromate transporter [Bacilli bacterium]|nr:chromate transporter [Bacilli bacterium]HPV70239.1 chromate transporter [Bacilli bacterium]
MKNILLRLFLTFLKIGATTFGGGYAMIPIIRNDVVDHQKWLSEEELLEILAIAESTPGPIAVNVATYTGYKIKGFWGSVLATLGVVLPSFIIIFGISILYNYVKDNPYIAAAFMGIKAAVALLILTAGLRMLKKMKKTWYSIPVFILIMSALIVFDLFALNFSSVFLILGGAALGFFLFYLLPIIKKKTKKESDK